MAATIPEGPEGPNLTHALKRGCSNCGGTLLQISATTPNAGEGEGLYVLCECGYEELITLADMGATLDYSG